MKDTLKSLSQAAIVAVAVTSSPLLAVADVVTDWNKITVDATKTAGLNSNLGTRIDAIEAIAVYDAVNSIKRFGTSYHYNIQPSGPASAEAAAAQAAHDVLVNYFPAQQTNLDANLADISLHENKIQSAEPFTNCCGNLVVRRATLPS